MGSLPFSFLILSWGYFAVFIFLGIYASISDFKTRRVPNSLFLSAYFFLIIGYAVLLLVWPFDSPSRFEYLKFIFINFFLSFIAAVVLWYRRIWPAGDAKLFFLMSLILVLIRPNLWGFPYWTALKMVINIFIPAVFLIIPLAAYRQWRDITKLSFADFMKQNQELLRRWMGNVELARGWYLAKFLWNILVISALIRFFMGKIHGPWKVVFQGAVYACSYLLWSKIYRWLKKFNYQRYAHVLTTLCLAGIAYLTRQSFLNLLMGGAFVSLEFSLLFMAAKFMENHLKIFQIHQGTIGQLCLGDVLIDQSWDEIVQLCATGEPEYEFRRYADGLSREDLETIRKFCSPDKEVVVCETRPFAFWIFFGALWTLFANQNFPQWLISLWRAHF